MGLFDPLSKPLGPLDSVPARRGKRFNFFEKIFFRKKIFEKIFFFLQVQLPPRVGFCCAQHCSAWGYSANIRCRTFAPERPFDQKKFFSLDENFFSLRSNFFSDPLPTGKWPTGSSQAVPHPSTVPARRCLTSVIGRERVLSSRYEATGRERCRGTLVTFGRPTLGRARCGLRPASAGAARSRALPGSPGPGTPENDVWADFRGSPGVSRSRRGEFRAGTGRENVSGLLSARCGRSGGLRPVPAALAARGASAVPETAFSAAPGAPEARETAGTGPADCPSSRPRASAIETGEEGLRETRRARKRPKSTPRPARDRGVPDSFRTSGTPGTPPDESRAGPGQISSRSVKVSAVHNNSREKIFFQLRKISKFVLLVR